MLDQVDDAFLFGDGLLKTLCFGMGHRKQQEVGDGLLVTFDAIGFEGQFDGPRTVAKLEFSRRCPTPARLPT